ncbi:MAG TPA: malectin domain-containing carbohydrate-binding protein [Phycisphaerae bacterium]|nr:malectin domain-containing carbohydrate-binding protein [Phycisphaerae bacterium]
MSYRFSRAVAVIALAWCSAASAHAATTQKRYYAHDAVEDKHGVIAPWYKGQNGQLDFRVRIAAETLKRYPWTDAKKAVAAAPEYVFNGAWKIAPDGKITIPEIRDWANGDLGQRAAYVLSALVDYYRYSGDAAAIAHMSILGDVLLDHCQTPADHPWPRFLISVPTKGKVYGQCDPHGMIQLDIVAEAGIGLLRAYQITGNERWFDAVKHWADLLAEKRSREPGMPPWNRYANPEDPTWTEDQQTGGVAFILAFFDELIRAGYTGKNNAIVEARDAGRAYLRDVLLPRWTVNDTWGRNYWDWPDPVQAENVTEFVVRYLMENPDAFPNWQNDARNILSLFLNRTSVSPGSKGDVYSGAWAYPESSSCCGRSLWYGPLELAHVYAQYGELADSEWGRELGRRQAILATYDCHETGVVEDNIDGGPIVAGDWFKIAHPMALKYALAAMAWLPDVFGAARENHIMRTSSVVRSVIYRKGGVFYTTYDAPPRTIEVLRLAFRPTEVLADNTTPLKPRSDPEENGYQVKELAGGDFLVCVRHDGYRNVAISGDDPQEVADDKGLTFTGSWRTDQARVFFDQTVHIASAAGATMTAPFTGNQVRLIGQAGPEGGLADVYVDDVKQLVGIDCWNPVPRYEQVLYYRNGLTNGKHTLKIVVRGTKNPLSQGTNVYVDAVEWSSASPTSPQTFGEGGGPIDTQRWIFGYPERTDYIDSRGHAWRPATEVVTPSRDGGDSVADTWWTQRRRLHIAGTDNPELYRYGMHAHEFRATFTVGPGTYYARLKFAETRTIDPKLRTVTVFVNDREAITNMDIAATAGGFGRAVNVVVPDIQPKNGVVDIRFLGPQGGEAIVQAIEVGPGNGGRGARPVSIAAALPTGAAPGGNLLRNPDFEGGVNGQVGAMMPGGGGFGWNYLFAGPARSYIWGESAYSEHPDWGLPAFHHGREAIRTHTDGCGHTVIYQDVAVAPEAPYQATAWVRAVDLHGNGFGKDACDSAGLWVQELDKDGRIVVNHPKIAVTAACEYRQLSRTFTTTKTTATVRFSLDTVIACPYTEGHVTYDDCALVRQEAK